MGRAWRATVPTALLCNYWIRRWQRGPQRGLGADRRHRFSPGSRHKCRHSSARLEEAKESQGLARLWWDRGMDAARKLWMGYVYHSTIRIDSEHFGPDALSARTARSLSCGILAEVGRTKGLNRTVQFANLSIDNACSFITVEWLIPSKMIKMIMV